MQTDNIRFIMFADTSRSLLRRS